MNTETGNFNSPQVQLRGISLIKLIHIIIQFSFLIISINYIDLKDPGIVQILIPLPVGAFILLSSIGNLIVFCLHMLENSKNIEISISEDGNMLLNQGKRRKSKSNIIKISDNLIEFGNTHESFAWSIAFMLGFVWNFYLISEGLKLINVKGYVQGNLLLLYGALSGILYLIMWLYPDLKIVGWDEEKQEGLFLIISPISISIFNREIYFGRRDIKVIQAQLMQSDVKFITKNKNDWKSYLIEKKMFVMQTLIWLVIWIFSSNLTLSFYHYQFVNAFIFIPLMYNLRRLLMKEENLKEKPIWIYPFWALAFHEIGVKAWHITALCILSPSIIIWTLPVAWILYILILIEIIFEIRDRIMKSESIDKKIKIGIISVLIIDILLQLSVILSTWRILPFYISLLEIGPLF
ncbi:MAG: hypothetical protein GY870_03490 [archaeon]|nr:hypothetical protein [archaeon]